jgi:hypothetical protein
MRRLRFRIARFSLVAVAIAMVACSSDSSTTTTVVGTYTLKTVDGVVLPAPLKDEFQDVLGTYTSGTATLTTAGAYTESKSYTFTNGLTGVSSSSGTYVVSGSTITFTVSTGALNTATFTGGNTISITVTPQVFGYVK